jgi:pyruvate dehydrogenase E1 component
MAENKERPVSDIDPVETREWLEALDAVVQTDGQDRATYLIKKLVHQFQAFSQGTSENFLAGFSSGLSCSTPYVNSIPLSSQPAYPGDLALEKKAEKWIRWNAALMVAHANKVDGSLGGHISTYASSCSLYEVGFNHFFKAGHDGDMIYYQGHAVPGVYARSFALGKLELGKIENFRQQVDGNGVGSYPHPWLQPNYWQFPTVSMGLGPITAIYQARFLKYMHHRGFKDTSKQKVWAFCGDGEMDEPESLGAIARAGREKLDNLIFVVNCNLQRLDGLVNGNGKIIQELESVFIGAGWRVIKVIWGSAWEALLAKDKSGLLIERMQSACDGDYQSYQARGGAYMREHFFGKSPELLALVADMSDEDLQNLGRGGHEHEKIYAAYKAATEHQGSPVVLLTKTVKGMGLGAAGESKNIAHNVKKLKSDELKYYRDRLGLTSSEVPDSDIENYVIQPLNQNLPEIQYLHQRREALGGEMPKRSPWNGSLTIPSYRDFAKRLLEGTSEGREMSTTTAYVQILTALCKDPNIGKHIVPITPDESRTFGMEGLFRQLGIYNAAGQNYEPEDRSQVMWYKEAVDGQILQEGINEVGSMGSWIAVGTSYANLGIPMIPMYIYYSMFGFQRTMDLCWLAGDARVRGFLLGATAGRTTLNGEGLQHEDGHSHVLSNLVPNCISYDPTYAYELAVIIESGLKRMYANNEDVYFYITMMNENYAHPAMPEGIEEGILKGLYLLHKAQKPTAKKHVQLLGSGAILREVEAAAELLMQNFGVSSDVWSMTSPTELYRNCIEVERYNRLHLLGAKDKDYQVSFLEQSLAKTEGPIIASTDYVRLHASQLHPYMPAQRKFVALGADGYGRSDSREKLRSFFEVDRYHVAFTALKALADEGLIEFSVVREAMKKYQINPDASFPMRA